MSASLSAFFKQSESSSMRVSGELEMVTYHGGFCVNGISYRVDPPRVWVAFFLHLRGHCIRAEVALEMLNKVCVLRYRPTIVTDDIQGDDGRM